MNLTEAQRVIDQHRMATHELPQELEFREHLKANAETVVRSCGMLFAPGGASRTEIREGREEVMHVVRTENPAVEVVTALKAAARELRTRCLAYR